MYESIIKFSRNAGLATSLALANLSSPAGLFNTAAEAKSSSRSCTDFKKNGTASWYGPRFYGKQTATGEIFKKSAKTAASRDIPYGSTVKVTNQRNGRSVTLRINDNGPFEGGRILDASYQGAEELGMLNSGTAPVSIQMLTCGRK